MTQNNSTEMKTVVETYIIEETAELIYDDGKLSEWDRGISELGLKGQESMRKQDKSPIPYMFMNENLKNVFGTLCPKKVSVEDYDINPIPLEILSHISLAKRERYFQKIQIWYDDKDKGLACIGISGVFIPVSSDYEWHHGHKQESSEKALEWLSVNRFEPYNKEGGYISDEKLYLIGRWADVKRSFKELASIAKERFISNKRSELTKMIRNMQRELEDLEDEANLRLNPPMINEFPF